MTQPINRGKLLAAITGLVAVAAVSTSIWLHPPSENRAQRLDQIRIESMNNIDRAINMYFKVNHVLPPDLKTLNKDGRQFPLTWEDPETRQPFEYQISGERSYRLCANFARNDDVDQGYFGHIHKAGHDCIDYTID